MTDDGLIDDSDLADLLRNLTDAEFICDPSPPAHADRSRPSHPHRTHTRHPANASRYEATVVMLGADLAHHTIDGTLRQPEGHVALSGLY